MIWEYDFENIHNLNYWKDLVTSNLLNLQVRIKKDKKYPVVDSNIDIILA